MALGANLGSPRRTLERAVRRLAGALHRIRVSPVYRTAPVGGPPQPDYLNAVAVGETRLSPVALLVLLQAIEDEAGRVRVVGRRDEPRTLDLDLLLYGTRRIATRDLTVPHPRLAERRFVLAPLADLAPRHVVPGAGKTVARLLAEAPDQRITHAGGISSPA